jgi:carbon monoxide dehydrogenase subunit G
MKYFSPIVIAALFAGIAIAAEAPSEVHGERANWGLYSHESILIDRPATKVWPFILHPDQWKRALQHQRVSGKPGAVGEIVAESLAAGQPPLFYSETVELVPNVRRTIKLYAPNHGPLIGFASWEIEEEDAKTRVTYHVYSETLLSPEELNSQTPAQIAEAQKASDSSNKARFRTELTQLKRLVEASAH